MTENKPIEPLENELPSQFAERLGELYSSKVSSEHKKSLGQFFTTFSLANFMASLCEQNRYADKVKILDPGCGIGILSVSLIEYLVSSNANIEKIDLVAFETDNAIIDYTDQCFNYLRNWLEERDVEFKFFLCKNDFILHNTNILHDRDSDELYDIIISNPPYFKLPKGDIRIEAAKPIIYGQSNIYTIFLLIAAKLLDNNGQLVFITPRSFCSGSYYRLFRELFFSLVDIKNIHLFSSRKEAFKKDRVLQENLIVSATKKLFDSYDFGICLSFSEGINDISCASERKYKFSDLVNFNSYQKILHLPLSERDDNVIKVFKTWTNSLKSLGLKISTGPVVDFRSEKFIKKKKSKNTVPLIWFHNVDMMKVSWPKDFGYNGKFKGQFIISNEESVSRLIKNRNYVFLKRFSTKDDNRRLVAAPYQSSLYNYEIIGVENHLNYIYGVNHDLTIDEITGISTLLNSKIFDLYFRTFNGNINVSASELKEFPLPDLKKIRMIGKKVLSCHKLNLDYDIDALISSVFNVNIDLSEYN